MRDEFQVGRISYQNFQSTINQTLQITIFFLLLGNENFRRNPAKRRTSTSREKHDQTYSLLC